MKKFHVYHIIKIFTSWEEKTPFDLAFRRYTQKHHQLGSKDRKVLQNVCFDLIRWSLLLDQGKEELSWEERLHIFLHTPLDTLKNNIDFPLHVRCSTPKWIFEKLASAYGIADAFEICLSLNERAPFTIRANRLKITRDALYKLLSTEYAVEKCALAEDGLLLEGSPFLLSSPLYESGLFEIQDEASQYVSSYISAKPGEEVLDFCAGSLGKTLSMAATMEGKGKIYAHDIRPQILEKGKERIERAGVTNVIFGLPEKPVDTILVDAPCSGSGTWRRRPDSKLFFTKEELAQLVKTQQKILKEAFSFLKPEGRMVYATCSLFPEENQEQVNWLLDHFPLEIEKPPFQSIVKKQGMDGFFAASLKRKVVVEC
jgi:16S rRNA C967 or C1407 C5-methylase (RsmB/RsmF family)